jgi:RNA polymerase sigma factor (sigma-70 family)
MLDFDMVYDGCVQGDRTHQKIIYDNSYSYIYRICLRYSNSKEQAEDLTQDIFIKIFANIVKFKGSNYKQLGGWANKLASNYCIDIIRKKEIQTIGSGSYGDYLNIENISENYNEDCDEILYDIDDIIIAIKTLTPRYRTVFNMYFMDGFTHNEISDKLKICVGSSKSNLFKAKVKLREILINNKIVS